MPLPSNAKYLTDYVNNDEAKVLIENIDALPWRTDLQRRVQHYGYSYDYRARTVSKEDYLGLLPEWLDNICNQLVSQQHFPSLPNQVIVNEYEPGQGISSHIDCIPCFGDTIVSLSLLSGCEMVFENRQTTEKKSIYLEENSLLVLSGEARYGWTHGIPPRKSDFTNKQRVLRNRRLSLTLRTVIVSNQL